MGAKRTGKTRIQTDIIRRYRELIKDRRVEYTELIGDYTENSRIRKREIISEMNDINKMRLYEYEGNSILTYAKEKELDVKILDLETKKEINDTKMEIELRKIKLDTDFKIKNIDKKVK